MIGRPAVRTGLILLAAGAAVTSLPAEWIERWYSRGVYPSLQAPLTAATNTIALAFLDLLAAVVLTGVIVSLVRRLRRWRANGLGRTAARSVLDLAVLGSVVYLVFLMLWGLNYRRVPLEQKIDYAESRVTPDAARQLARDAIQHVNALYADAHREQTTGRLEHAFAAAQRRLGASRLATPGVPKRSLAELYFRRAAIDGMTNPFFLEVILNPDVLPIEHPFVLAHEWGHLAGYADESEANLVAWLTCLEGNGLARYSGWLAIYSHVMGGLPRADARALAQGLDQGPRADLAAINARLARATPVVRTIARDAYDAYLRANRIEEGIASYDAVVRLILGSGRENGWAPRVTSR
jgi:hypothetical protein